MVDILLLVMLVINSCIIAWAAKVVGTERYYKEKSSFFEDKFNDLMQFMINKDRSSMADQMLSELDKLKAVMEDTDVPAYIRKGIKEEIKN